jgi:hypothetical protein
MLDVSCFERAAWQGCGFGTWRVGVLTRRVAGWGRPHVGGAMGALPSASAVRRKLRSAMRGIKLFENIVDSLVFQPQNTFLGRTRGRVGTAPRRRDFAFDKDCPHAFYPKIQTCPHDFGGIRFPRTWQGGDSATLGARWGRDGGAEGRAGILGGSSANVAFRHVLRRLSFIKSGVARKRRK